MTIVKWQTSARLQLRQHLVMNCIRSLLCELETSNLQQRLRWLSEHFLTLGLWRKFGKVS